MPRGFRVDHMETANARLDGNSWGIKLVDPRSFISQEKVTPHTNREAKKHLILWGVDKGTMRAEILKRASEGWHEYAGNIYRCWNCKERVYEDSGEWDHIENGPGLRCDCPQNGRVSCRKCHREQHPQVQFGKASA